MRMQCSNGATFDFHNIDANKTNGSIDIDVIATVLSKLPRFNAHTNMECNVANHSLLVADIVSCISDSPELQLKALLHDAHEVYMGDISKPLKQFFERSGCIDVIRELEEEIDEVIFQTLGIDPLTYGEDKEVIKAADLKALATERYYCMRSSLDPEIWEGVDEPINFPYEIRDSAASKSLFIDRYEKLKRDLTELGLNTD